MKSAVSVWALHLGVPVEPVLVRTQVPTLALQEIEKLDNVPLDRVRPALAMLQVVLAEEPVERRGIAGGEVPVDPVGG